MNNVMKINGHTAVMTFEPDIEMFSGEFTGLNGGTDFYAYSVEELKHEGIKSLEIFLDECLKDGIGPYKHYSGKFTARLPSERHAALVTAGLATGLSLNEMLNEMQNEGVDLFLQKYV